MSKKKILICGATGFIGRNLVEHYATQENYQVFAIWNRKEPYSIANVEWIQADLTKEEDVIRATKGIDILVQAAATTSGSKDIVNRPHIHITDNAVMNSLLLRAAHTHAIEQFVFFSCIIMYPTGDTPIKESDFDPSREFHKNYFGAGWTKLYIEKMCEFFADLGKTKHTVIRHSNIYGPYDKFDLERSHVFGATMTKVMQAKDNIINVWGTGEEKRDLLYIEDLVNFVDAAIQKQQSAFDIYNVGYGDCFSVNEIVAKIMQAAEKKLEIRHDNSKPSIKTNLYLDCSKAKTELNWEPKTSFEAGITKTLNWYKHHHP